MLSRLSLSVAVVVCACAQLPDQVESKQFDFAQHALSFSNFGDRYEAGKFNADLAIRMFGADAVCQPGMAECVVDPNIQVFIDEVNKGLASGHSEGFAVVSQLFALGKLKSTDFGAPRPVDVNGSSTEILRELAYFAATQRIEGVHANDKKFDAKGSLAFLAEALTDPNEGYRLVVAIKQADGSFGAGHAMVPFGYFKTEQDGQYVVRLYDPNFPQTERRMNIDVKANSWRYDGTFDSRDPLIYEGTSENKNLLYFSPVTPRLGKFTAPHASEGFTVTLGDGTGLITGADNEVGFKDGQVVEKGGLVLPGAANCACSNANQVVQMLIKKAGLPQVMTLTAKGATLTGNNVTVQVNDYAEKGNSYKTEEVSVTADGKAVVTHKGVAEDDARTVTVTTKNKDGSTTSVTVTTSGNTESVTIDTSDPSNAKVTGKSSGNQLTSQVVVKVTNTQSDGTQKTVTSTSSAGEGRDINVTAQPLAGTATANNGLPADSCKNGRRDSNEPNTDCGAECGLKPPADRTGSGRCVRYSKCFVDGDCAIGDLCWRNSCWEPRCNDGVKNGQETDIDCGGSPCGACGLNQACSGSSNCGNGLLCDQGRCATATPLKHRLTISGLGPNGSFTIAQQLDGTYAQRSIQGNATGAPFDIEFDAAKTLRVALGQNFSNFACFIDGPRDTTDWYWSWDAPATGGTGMSSRRTITCYRKSGSIEVPFVINGCQFQRIGKTPDAGFFIAREDATKFYDSTVSPPAEMWWVQLYDGNKGNYGLLTQNIESKGVLGGMPPSYNITIGPDTSGFYKEDRGYGKYDPVTTTRFTMSCLPDAPLTGTLGVQDTTITPRVFCTCSTIIAPDAGTDAGSVADAGTDAGVDAGRFDAGFDAGLPDAGFDAGVPDAGVPDAGVVDAGPASCSIDSQCGVGANCYCASNPGNCAGTGLCLGTKAVFSTPTTDGVAASGTYTVPAGCTKVHLAAWGAAGGVYSVSVPFPMQLAGGAGGFAAGAMSAAPGDVVKVWVGTVGKPTAGIVGGEGVGSYAGTPANGGDGDGLEG